MTTRITCVYDEGSQPGTSLIGAKGTSFMIEKDGKRVLFNTGLRDRYLIHNMEHLEIDPGSIDAVVVSQSNPSDSAALNGFLKVRESAVDVYCPDGLYGKRTLISRGVGLSDYVKDFPVFHSVGEWQEIIPGMYITPYVYDPKGYGEIFMVVKEGNRIALLSGRCSCGPEKAIDMVRGHFGKTPDAFIGPVFLEKKKKTVAASYAETLSEISDLYLNHCVGKDGILNLRVHLGLAGVHDFYVGDRYDL